MWIINRPKKVRRSHSRKKTRKRTRKNPLLTIANRGKKTMARRKRSHRRRRYAHNRRRRGGISLAPRRVYVMNRKRHRRRRKSYGLNPHRRRYYRRRYRRNPSISRSLRSPRLGSLVGPAIGVAAGVSGPFIVEPFIPWMPSDPMMLFAKKALAGALTGVAGNVAASMRFISKKTSNYVWIGVAVNMAVSLLRSQAGIGLPGFAGYGQVGAPGIGSASVERFEPLYQ